MATKTLLPFFKNTISKLDKLILKLQSNTGSTGKLIPVTMDAKQETQPEKKPQNQPQGKKEESKELPQPTAEDFAKLDIRVGKIVECWRVRYH